MPTPARGGGGSSSAGTGDAGAVLVPSWEIPFAAGLGVYGAHADIPTDLRNAILVTDFFNGHLYRIEEDSVASFTLPGIERFLYGVAPVGPSTTTIMVSARDDDNTDQPSVARYAWNGTAYTLEASGPGANNASGGVVAGGRYWQFSGPSFFLGEDFIRSWPLTGALDDAASQTLMVDGPSGRVPLDIDTFLPNPDGALFFYDAYSLAVDADGIATHVYWVTNAGYLIRYSDEGGVATATVIADPSDFLPGTGGGGVAWDPDAHRLYVARGGKAYYVDNPATGTTVTLTEFAPGALPPATAWGGAVASGSVIFALPFAPTKSVFQLSTPAPTP